MTGAVLGGMSKIASKFLKPETGPEVLVVWNRDDPPRYLHAHKRVSRACERGRVEVRR